MAFFDVVIVFILAGFFFYGLFYGLIRALGSIFGLLFGFWAAHLTYLQVYQWAEKFFLGREGIGKAIVFSVIFIIVNRLVIFLFLILDKTYDFISFIPFLRTINRLLGALFGLTFGWILLALALYGASTYPMIQPLYAKLSTNSQLAPSLVASAGSIIPFLPDFWNKIRSWFGGESSVDLSKLNPFNYFDFSAVKNLIKSK